MKHFIAQLLFSLPRAEEVHPAAPVGEPDEGARRGPTAAVQARVVGKVPLDVAVGPAAAPHPGTEGAEPLAPHRGHAALGVMVDGPGVRAEALDVQHVERRHDETLGLSRFGDGAPPVEQPAPRLGHGLDRRQVPGAELLAKARVLAPDTIPSVDLANLVVSPCRNLQNTSPRRLQQRF